MVHQPNPSVAFNGKIRHLCFKRLFKEDGTVFRYVVEYFQAIDTEITRTGVSRHGRTFGHFKPHGLVQNDDVSLDIRNLKNLRSCHPTFRAIPFIFLFFVFQNGPVIFPVVEGIDIITNSKALCIVYSKLFGTFLFCLSQCTLNHIRNDLVDISKPQK